MAPHKTVPKVSLPQHVQDAFEGSSVYPEIKTIFKQSTSPATYNGIDLHTLVGNIAHYVLDLKSQTATPTEAPAAKKRKLNEDAPNGASAGSSISGSWTGIERYEGISFSIPQRKKLVLEISSAKTGGIRAVTAAGAEKAEFGITWSSIEHVIRLPVPEKAQAQENFCIIPVGGDGLSTDPSPFETMVWTASDTLAKGAREDESTQAEAIGITLAKAKLDVQVPDDKEFASEVQTATTRKGRKAYHVKAFKGSKEGYLFFLARGILWAFKKPLIFFSFASIDSISYTSVLQRTFNLVISARPLPSSAPSTTSSQPEVQELEFSMLDQADFAGIDTYVRRHGLQDASLAEARRAKKYNVNGLKKEVGAEGGEEGEGEGDLAKAAREAEGIGNDEDDEEDDENFDPGSDGESEGSGTSDEDDEDGEGGGGEEYGEEDEDEEMEGEQ